MRIRVNPDQLRALSQQLSNTSSELHSLTSRLSNAMGKLDWDARHKAGVDGEVEHARRLASSLAGKASELSHYVGMKAGSFEEADRQGVTAVENVSGTFAQWQEQWRQSPLGQRNAYPDDLVDAQLRLGNIIGNEAATPVPTPVPTLVPGGASQSPINADNLLDAIAGVLRTYSGLNDFRTALTGIPAALALGYTLHNGKLIITGSQALKNLAGLSPSLTKINPGNLAGHIARNSMKSGIIGAAISVAEQWVTDIKVYRNQGAAKLTSALLVDGVLKAGLGIGVALGVGAITAFVAASLPAVAVVAVGVGAGLLLGVVANAAFNWLADPKVGIRDAMINTTARGVTLWADVAKATVSAAGNVANKAAKAVDSTLKNATNAVTNFFRPKPQRQPAHS